MEAIAHVKLESSARRLSIEGSALSLTTVEYEILSRLAAAAGSVIPRDRLIPEVFERQADPSDRSLDVHIRRLRRKLGQHAWLIVTVRGTGHMLRAAGVGEQS